jgi:hypothetical protein
MLTVQSVHVYQSCCIRQFYNTFTHELCICTQGLYTVLIKSWSNVIKQQHKLAQLRKLCFMFFYRTGIRIITVSFPTSSLQRLLVFHIFLKYL